ncbi:MAG: beta-propeller domain-containing protein [Oscillospiraceae bacterium]|nr:beta-propeller domain-containing protein [Oscillospiraceae bacterium]
MRNKKTLKSLDKLTKTELPEALRKENILEMLGDAEQNEVNTVMPVKKSYAKRLIPIAASLALVLGLAGLYFGTSREKIDTQEPSENAVEVMRYDDYSEIYAKFQKLKSDFDKQNHTYNIFGGLFNEYAKEDAADMAEASGGLLSDTESTGVPGASASVNTNESLFDKTYGTSHGETNTQEVGVDEGDIIKTDGKYIYAVNTLENTFSIIDCTGGKMAVVSTVDLTGKMGVSEMYINGDCAVLVGHKFKTYDDDSDVKVYNSSYAIVDSIYSGYSGDTAVYVYDISDRTEPKEDTNYFQQGGYYSSRMIGSKLYCVSTYYVDLGVKDIKDRCIPEIGINGQEQQVPADCISVISGTESPSYAVITVLDTNGGTEPTVEAVLGSCEELYATTENLFVCETKYGATQTTKIYKFDYTDTGVDYKCKGEIGGYLHDQFSMSLYDGYLRVATTQNVAEGPWNNTTNTLYILDGDMQTVGKVDDLANGELIKSARFIGNTAYIVTFVQTDPLFVIDVSDPTDPQVKSELKLPGFSQYLHPIADGFLVGVGRDGTETGINDDCKVSLFDVSDPSAPAEVSNLKVMNGKGYADSDLDHNHKLFINLPNGEFAVSFYTNALYWVNDYDFFRNSLYIRYKISDGELQEVARYNLGDDTATLGATYIGDTFYALVYDYSGRSDKTSLVAFSLETNEEIGRIKL